MKLVYWHSSDGVIQSLALNFLGTIQSRSIYIWHVAILFGVFADLRQIYPVWVETIYMRSKQQTGHTKERRKCKFYFLVKEKIVLYYFQFKPRKVFKVFIHFPGSVSAKNSRLIKVAKRSFKLSSRQLEKCGWFISYQFRSRWLLPLPPSISALSHFRLIPNYIYNSTIFQFR